MASLSRSDSLFEVSSSFSREAIFDEFGEFRSSWNPSNEIVKSTLYILPLQRRLVFPAFQWVKDDSVYLLQEGISSSLWQFWVFHCPLQLQEMTETIAFSHSQDCSPHYFHLQTLPSPHLSLLNDSWVVWISSFFSNVIYCSLLSQDLFVFHATVN